MALRRNTDPQVNLSILDLAGNFIEHVENVEALASLEDFWVPSCACADYMPCCIPLDALPLCIVHMRVAHVPKQPNNAHMATCYVAQFNDNKPFANLDEIDKFCACPKMTTVRCPHIVAYFDMRFAQIYLYGTPACNDAGTAYRSRVKALIPTIQQIDDH